MPIKFILKRHLSGLYDVYFYNYCRVKGTIRDDLKLACVDVIER